MKQAKRFLFVSFVGLATTAAASALLAGCSAGLETPPAGVGSGVPSGSAESGSVNFGSGAFSGDLSGFSTAGFSVSVIFGAQPRADFLSCTRTPPSDSGSLGVAGGAAGSCCPSGAGTGAGGPCCGGVAMANFARPSFGPNVTASVAPPPISGGTLLALRRGDVAVAADPDRDSVYVVSTSSAALLHTIALQPGDEPGRLVEDGAGRVHVALRTGGALVTLDPATGGVVARRPVCPAPRGVAWDKTTDRVWVACATGELVAMPAGGGPATTQWVIERDLRDVLVRDGQVSVTKFRSAEILRIASDGTIARRDSVLPFDPSSEPRVAWRAVLLSTNQTLVVHQDESKASISTQSPGGYGDGKLGAVASRCTTIDDLTGTQVSTSPLFDVVLPVDVAVSPNGAFDVVVAAGGGLSQGRAELAVVNSGAATAATCDAGSLPNLCDVAGSLARAGTGSSGGSVSGSLAGGVAGSCGGAGSPGGSVTGSSGGSATTFSMVPTSVPAVPTEEPIAAAFDGIGHLLVQTREPASIRILRAYCDGVSVQRPLGGTQVVLSSASRRDTGHEIFHAAAGAAIACASCHPEGGDDGHVWVLDGNARRTPSLRGTIAGTAPYHWPGDQKDFSALAFDVYTGRMGGTMLAAPQTSALMSWIEAIPAPPAPSWVDGAAAIRGQAVFARADAACATCHSGPKLTNNQTMNVGTCGTFQVPPLVGVGWRAPFMHNGCASTLADRFGKCASPRHGSLATLSAGDVSDLTAYLETL